MKVLIVDDEELIAEELAEVVDFLGHEPVVSSGVDQALGLLATSGPFDLVMTDLRMPQKSGEVLIEEIRKMKDTDVRIVVMSGHGGDEFNETLKQLNSDNVFDIVSKPVGWEAVKGIFAKLSAT